jgi:hypothetical protein
MNGLINVKFVIRLSLPQPSGDGHGLHRLFDDIDLLMFGNVVMDAARRQTLFGGQLRSNWISNLAFHFSFSRTRCVLS